MDRSWWCLPASLGAGFRVPCPKPTPGDPSPGPSFKALPQRAISAQYLEGMSPPQEACPCLLWGSALAQRQLEIKLLWHGASGGGACGGLWKAFVPALLDPSLGYCWTLHTAPQFNSAAAYSLKDWAVGSIGDSRWPLFSGGKSAALVLTTELSDPHFWLMHP